MSYSLHIDRIRFKGWFSCFDLDEVRKNYPTLSRGNFIEVKSNKSEVFSYLRTGKYDKILVVNNLSENKVYTELDSSSFNFNQEDHEIKMQELITKNPKFFIIQDKKLIIKLKPYETMWLSFK